MKVVKIIFIILAVSIGLYPLLYFLVDMNQGLLTSKSDELLADSLWNTMFYAHIGFGGIAMLTGFSQFFQGIRAKHMRIHRRLGKIYCIVVMLSGIAGLYIAFYATGGKVSMLGFGSLAILWLWTTVRAYLAVINGKIDAHRRWMIRSYALCFAAVTLRLWLPLLTGAFGIDFMIAYPIIAWLCWVPNIIVAELIIKNS